VLWHDHGLLGKRRAAWCDAPTSGIFLAHILPYPRGTLARPPPVVGRVWCYRFSQWWRVARRPVCALVEVHSAPCVCLLRCAFVRALHHFGCSLAARRSRLGALWARQTADGAAQRRRGAPRASNPAREKSRWSASGAGVGAPSPRSATPLGVRAPRPRPRAPRALTPLFRAGRAALAVHTTLGARTDASARPVRNRTSALLVSMCRARCQAWPHRVGALRRRVRGMHASPWPVVIRPSCRATHHRSGPARCVGVPKYSPVASRAGKRRAAWCDAPTSGIFLAHILPYPRGTLARPPPVVGRVWCYRFSQWWRVARRPVCALVEVHSAPCARVRRYAAVRAVHPSMPYYDRPYAFKVKNRPLLVRITSWKSKKSILWAI
jgi:hypothetical protein